MLDAIQRLSRNIKRRSSSRGSAHGRAQGKTLRLIAQNDGIRANDLAKMLDIRPPSLTQKLNKLEEDGNIRRERDLRDARVIRLYITEIGKESLRRRDLERDRVTRDFCDCLTPEEKALFCRLCGRLSDNLEAICQQEKEMYELPNVVPFYHEAAMEEHTEPEGDKKEGAIESEAHTG